MFLVSVGMFALMCRGDRIETNSLLSSSNRSIEWNGGKQMKKILSFALCMVILTFTFAGCGDKVDPKSSDQASTYESKDISTSVVAGNTRFAFDLFRQLNEEDKEQNIFISPLSISTALSMEYQHCS